MMMVLVALCVVFRQKHGLHVHLRDPSSYTPLRKEYQQPGEPKSLTLSSDMKFNIEEIAKFSEKDAKVDDLLIYRNIYFILI